MIAEIEVSTELARDWPAASAAARRLGILTGGPFDMDAFYAAEIFGFGAIVSPTWIYVARNGCSMGTHVPWFAQKWARLKASAR